MPALFVAFRRCFAVSLPIVRAAPHLTEWRRHGSWQWRVLRQRIFVPFMNDQDWAQLMAVEEFVVEVDADPTQNPDQDRAELPAEVPILPVRNTVLFPGIVMPITVGRAKSTALAKHVAKAKVKLIGVLAQKAMDTEDPGEADLYRVGTLAEVLRFIRMPDGTITIVIRGRSRFQLEEVVRDEPFMQARVTVLPEDNPQNEAAKALAISLKNEAGRIIELSPNIPNEANFRIQQISDLAFLIHFIAANLNLEVEQKQAVLTAKTLLEKGEMVLERLAHELHVLEISEEIQSKVKTDMDEQQRDFILRQQMKSIQEELGEINFEDEIEEYRARAAEKNWSEEAEKVFEKEVAKLYRINPGSPEYGVSVSYIETLLDLPWGAYTQDEIDLAKARKVLDADHYGLEQVKDRILDYLAVLQLKQDLKAPILLFYGPPGVGKTSLGKSIAKALGREFVRLALGGVRDEAEIRGHRRTYIGARHGRILQSLEKVGTGNPVLLLDEIDKVGNDFRGDPSSALLEVLDPEQNHTFSDHYLEIDYDLSPVLFIATANSLETIHPALRDRMEVIEINGYTQTEKLEIAKRHLVPEVRKAHGLKAKQLTFNDEAINVIIDRFTRESGVRELNRKLADVARGVARDVVDGKYKSVTVTTKKLGDYLGTPRFEKERYHYTDTPGVSVGLAWTPTGGDILFIETAMHTGSGRLHATGRLGEVMLESAHLAQTWLKANATAYRIDFSVFNNWDVHLHVPAGSVPKDGPSAGTALLTALASAFTQRKVKPGVAMTGEITLRGKVLPVGGIKEKVLAAARAGLETILLSPQNEKDVLEIKPQSLLDGLNIVYTATVADVLTHALEPIPASDGLELAPRGTIGLRP